MLIDLRSCLKKPGYDKFHWDNGLYVVCLKNLTHLLTLILLRDSPPIFLQHDKLLHLHRQNQYLPLYKQEGNWVQLTFAKTSGDQRVLINDSNDFYWPLKLFFNFKNKMEKFSFKKCYLFYWEPILPSQLALHPFRVDKVP